MKRKGEGSCLLKRGKPHLELPRWSISISEWSCSCTATTTLQGGTSEERALWMRLQAGETLIFQPVWKSGDNLMFEKPTKIREGEKREEGKKKVCDFEEDRVLQAFWSWILNNSLDATSSSKAVWKHTHAWQRFSSPRRCQKKVCHNLWYRQHKCSILLKSKPVF